MLLLLVDPLENKGKAIVLWNRVVLLYDIDNFYWLVIDIDGDKYSQ